MSKARLSRDVEMTFQCMHTIRAKAGTPVHPIKCGLGVSYRLRPDDVETDSLRNKTSLFALDVKHYYIWAPADAVEVLTD